MADDETRDFGEWLRHFRAAAGLTQEELAASAGLSVHGISDLERGARRWPRRDTVHLLAEALHLSPADRATLAAAARHRATKNASPDHLTASHTPERATSATAPSQSATVPNVQHAPAQTTPLIGRSEDVAAICQLLQGETRLLTITGPGGIGKTRVALQVAANVSARFPDGAYFVGLAAIREPELVLPALAQILGVTATANQSPLDALILALGDRHILLLLDNFEQVASAALPLGSLLASCAHVKLLVTSRVPLHLAGEQEYLLPPLAGPDPHQLPDVASLAAYPAIALFLQRAQAVKPDLVLTETNGPAVAEICARLDRLPLAIELAAARIRILPPRTLLQQLASRLRLALLTTGPQDAPARHQTLRNAIAWSYDLLTPQEQALFCRLSVFAGGFDLEAAEQVCLTGSHPDLNLDLLEGVSALVDHHLLWQSETAEGEARFGMLETIREYGQEWLDASGEAETLRRQHAEYYTTLAEQGDALLMVSVQRRTLDFLDQEHSNFRAALRWALEQQEIALGLRIAGALARFWKRRGYTSEGRQWLTQCLQLAESQHAEQQMQTPQANLAHIRALTGAGRLAWAQSDYASAKNYCKASLALSISAGEKREAAQAYLLLGNIACEQGETEQEITNYEECLRLFREVGHTSGVAAALTNLGGVMLEKREYQRAGTLLEESIKLFQQVNDELGVVNSIGNLANIARMQGDFQRADRLYERSQQLLREIGDRTHLAIHLGNQAYVALELHDAERAGRLLRETITIAREIGNTRLLTFAVIGLGLVDCETRQMERATRLLGSAAAAMEEIGALVSEDDRPLYERTLATLQSVLGDDRFSTLWAIGRTLTLQQAIAEALEETPKTSEYSNPSASRSFPGHIGVSGAGS